MIDLEEMEDGEWGIFEGRKGKNSKIAVFSWASHDSSFDDRVFCIMMSKGFLPLDWVQSQQNRGSLASSTEGGVQGEAA